MGNTGGERLRSRCGTVHPHMRGEYSTRGFEYPRALGSSPHAWGILNQQAKRGHCNRFIPTCVGNTCSKHTRTRCTTVHPHMRGEYMSTTASPTPVPGSSPHAWGILNQQAKRGHCNRFIPTCVGNTSRRPVNCSRIYGSSPHAWGIRTRHR